MDKNKSLDLTRRDFLISGTAALGSLAATPALAFSPTPASTERVLHIIGYSHIDAAWLWPWRDGSDEVLSTFHSALERMNETPDFCYSQSSSAYYRWVETADPTTFRKIQERIREGRWEVVGGWPVEPDCNIPSSESFVRHSLYGKEYCRRALGADVTVGLNPDSFGHAAGLPSLLKHAGYKYYVFMRPQEQEMTLPLLFWWEAPDGSRVLTLRIWHRYDAGASLIQASSESMFPPGSQHAAFFLGVGDHGGAITKKQIQEILELRKDSTLPKLQFSTLREFFRMVESSPTFASIPVVRGELQHHSRGCYSADGEQKILNRRAERGLGEAETVSLIANLSDGLSYPGTAYADSWWKVCFNQFHDMMAGTSLYSDYTDIRDSVGSACETANTSKVNALEYMAMRVNLPNVDGRAVFLFNPLPWRRKALFTHYDFGGGAASDTITRLTTEDGVNIPAQTIHSESMSPFCPRIAAWVELPPCGYRVLDLAGGEVAASEPLSSGFSVMEHGLGISSLTASDGVELLAASTGLVVIGDNSDTWAHGIDAFRNEIGRPTFTSAAVIEDGRVMRVIRQRAQWQKSEIILDITQHAGMDFIELHFIIDWREHEQMLKLEIPTVLASPKVFAKVPGAVIERGVGGTEEPYQDWIAVQGTIADKDYSVLLFNDSTYSYDCLNGLLRTVLIRSAPFARHNPGTVAYNDANAWQDQGRQERRFWLVGGRGTFADFAPDRRAEESQTPAEYVVCSAHAGDQPRERSFLNVLPSSIWVLAVKKAEQGQGTIIRLQERTGKNMQATLRSELLGLDHTIDFKPWELKTLLVKRIGRQRAEVREVSLLES